MRDVSKFERVADAVQREFAGPVAVLLIAVVVVVWRLILQSPADPDLFARISMGRLVETLQSVPLQDPFAFTPKLPIWIDHEWLSGCVFYQIAHRLGDVGLILLKLLVSAWTALLLMHASMRYTPHAVGRGVWAAVCLLEASYIWHSTIRCQVFTYVTIALTYYGFVMYREQGARYYLALVAVAAFALVNMHGGYALVLVTLWLLTACSLVQGKRWRWLAFVSLLVSLAPAATPYGAQRFITYLIHAITMDRPTIPEWWPLYQNPASFFRTIVITTPLIVGVIIMGRRRTWDFTALVMVGFSLYCAVSHERFIGFAMLTLIVFGAQYVSETITVLRSRVGFRFTMCERAGAIVGLVVLVGMVLHVFIVALRASTWRLDMTAYPVAATEWLRQSGATGRLLVDFNNGSFAQWRLYPRFTVSMDGRYEEVYTNETVERVAHAFMAHTPSGAAALQWIGPTHILFDASKESRKAQAALPSEWYEVYRDEKFSIFTNVGNHPKTETLSTSDFELWRALF